MSEVLPRSNNQYELDPADTSKDRNKLWPKVAGVLAVLGVGIGIGGMLTEGGSNGPDQVTAAPNNQDVDETSSTTESTTSTTALEAIERPEFVLPISSDTEKLVEDELSALFTLSQENSETRQDYISLAISDSQLASEVTGRMNERDAFLLPDSDRYDFYQHSQFTVDEIIEESPERTIVNTTYLEKIEVSRIGSPDEKGYLDFQFTSQEQLVIVNSEQMVIRPDGTSGREVLRQITAINHLSPVSIIDLEGNPVGDTVQLNSEIAEIAICKGMNGVACE